MLSGVSVDGWVDRHLQLRLLFILLSLFLPHLYLAGSVLFLVSNAVFPSVFIYEGIEMEGILIVGQRPPNARWCHTEPAHPTPEPQA